jgi:phage gp29-like protein
MIGQAPDQNLVVTPDGRPWQPQSAATDPIAGVAQVFNPFNSRQLYQEITPEVAARMMRNDYSLSQQQLLYKRVLTLNASFRSSYRNLVLAVAGLDWESIPRSKTLRRDQRIAEKVRDYVQQQIEGVPIASWVIHELWGEYAPFSFAENQWDLSTKGLRGFNLVDASRQYWDIQTSALKCLTLRSPGMGEPLAPNMWAVHTSYLMAGNPREGGCGPAVLFWHCANTFTTNDWLEYSHVYGKPWRLAFIRDPKDRASVIKAMRAIGVNGAGVFPEGTEVKLENGTSTSNIDAFDRLTTRGDDAVAELFTGHALTQKSKSGAGTLAGNGAMRVHEKIVKHVSRGVMTTFWRDVVVPMVSMKFGYDVAMEYTSFDSTWRLKYEPPVDKKARAQALGTVNSDLLAPLGKAIDLPQIQEEFEIAAVVDRVANVEEAQPGPDATGADEALDASRKARRGRVVAAKSKKTATPATPMQTRDDVDQVTAALGQRAMSEIGGVLTDVIDQTPVLADTIAAIWEGYGKLSRAGRKIAALERDGMTLGHVVARGDVVEENGDVYGD